MHRSQVLVVSVDGVLADTLLARQRALVDSALEVGLVDAVPELPVHWIAGRSWREAARQLTGSADDETLLDLTALAAERAWTQSLSHGLPVVEPEALRRCKQAAEHGWRVILRADSTRRSASALFDVLEEESGAVRTLTGDDPGVLHGPSVLLSQYAGIIAIAAGRQTVSCVEPLAVWQRMERAMSAYVQRGWPEL